MAQPFPNELKHLYDNTEFIGSGGFARVFKARRKDGRVVAVKIPLSLDEATGKSFLREITSWQRLSHKNIVSLFDANILPIPYLEQEYCDGGSLESLKKPLEISKACEIVFDIAEGLKYAHKQGIVHRDLKPQNILLTKDEVPKITDWGMSRVIAEGRSSTQHGYTPAYASPEQVSPKKFGKPDERTDIYQLGVIFYNLLTNDLPFKGDDLAEIASAIVMEKPAAPSELNPKAREVEHVVLRCLSKNKEERYQSVEDLQRELAGFVKQRKEREKKALEKLQQETVRREKEKEEQERLRREEAERKEKEEQERKALEEERLKKQREEQERASREDEKRKAREKRERKAKEDAEKKIEKAKQEETRLRTGSEAQLQYTLLGVSFGGWFGLVAASLAEIFFDGLFYNDKRIFIILIVFLVAIAAAIIYVKKRSYNNWIGILLAGAVAGEIAGLIGGNIADYYIDPSGLLDLLFFRYRNTTGLIVSWSVIFGGGFSGAFFSKIVTNNGKKWIVGGVVGAMSSFSSILVLGGQFQFFSGYTLLFVTIGYIVGMLFARNVIVEKKEQKEKKSTSYKKFFAVALVLGALLLGIWALAPGATNAPETPTSAPLIKPADFTNSIGIEFVEIPAGEFDMGSPSNEAYRYSDEGPAHRVKIANAFYMGKYEVTQKQWREVMGNNTSSFKGDNLPVESVSWNDVQEFIRKLNEKEGTNKYRLPSEAEWEYAARAETTTMYSFGDHGPKLGDYAWYESNSGSKTHEVGQKKPNPWVLYDMHGNVWEWVQDIYHGSYDGAPTDGSAWEGDGYNHVFRGGSWIYGGIYQRSATRGGCAGDCRSAASGTDNRGIRSYDLGFRLARDV